MYRFINKMYCLLPMYILNNTKVSDKSKMLKETTIDDDNKIFCPITRWYVHYIT